MRLRYLLDTNVVSEGHRRLPNPAVMRRIAKYEGRLATASTVWHELAFGVERLAPSRRKTDLRNYLDLVIHPSMPILAYDEEAASWQARERARLTALGVTVPFLDAQIAAVAATNDLILVTGNVRHYTCFEGVKVEDWSDN